MNQACATNDDRRTVAGGQSVAPAQRSGPANAEAGAPAATRFRDPALRQQYLVPALAAIPRLIGALDRNPLRRTYGCFDRQFWHYRTSAFPSQMYQEALWPLALVYHHPLPGNRWHREPAVRQMVVAALEYTARSSHADGSCDDYYPFERALGAAVFSLHAAAAAVELLGIDSPTVRAWLVRRARWVARHGETGRLTNHHALAAVGLVLAARLTGKEEFWDAARRRAALVLSWQHAEGWFDEYGGADPGYQTVTIDCLARLAGTWADLPLDEPLACGVRFCCWFRHPDHSYAGPYGSRGTYHFYPCGFERLAGADASAGDLAESYLRALAGGKQAHHNDDRLVAHQVGNLLEAYLAWSSTTPAVERQSQFTWVDAERRQTRQGSGAKNSEEQQTLPHRAWFPGAGLLARRDGKRHTVVSISRGGVFKHFQSDKCTTDCGLIVRTSDGRSAVSQFHELRAGHWTGQPGSPGSTCEVASRLHWVKFETATPLSMAAFHVGLVTVGRWCRSLVRAALQRRLITGRKECPIRLVRRFEFDPADGISLRVVDRIELLRPGMRLSHAALASDLQAAYVAAANVYQDSVLQGWTDLSHLLDELHRDGVATLVREYA